jgi:hypothetical protein
VIIFYTALSFSQGNSVLTQRYDNRRLGWDTAETILNVTNVNLTSTGTRVIKNTDMTGACGGFYNDFSGNMGIVGTPVVDTLNSSLYVVSRDVTTKDTAFRQYFHSLDIHTGAEKKGSRNKRMLRKVYSPKKSACCFTAFDFF